MYITTTKLILRSSILPCIRSTHRDGISIINAFQMYACPPCSDGRWMFLIVTVFYVTRAWYTYMECKSSNHLLIRLWTNMQKLCSHLTYCLFFYFFYNSQYPLRYVILNAVGKWCMYSTFGPNPRTVLPRISFRVIEIRHCTHASDISCLVFLIHDFIRQLNFAVRFSVKMTSGNSFLWNWGPCAHSPSHP